ncbi:MAG TPA: alpha/beta family hydrolase [Chryseolinea sp.]
MKSKLTQISVSDSIGKISLLTVKPSNVKSILVLAHGAGAGMTHPFMENLAQQLAELSIGTVRYNFPYMEKNSKRPDVPAVAEKTVGEVLANTQKVFSDLPIFLGGKSFGGRMSSQFVSKQKPEGLRGIVFYGFPLHAPGKSESQRADHLKAIEVPMLFLQGTNDALATLSLMEKVCSGLKIATLVKFEGADHSFKIKKSDAMPELVANTAKWLESLY